MTDNPTMAPSRRRLLVAAGLGLTGLAIVVAVVLPAEFGMDPTGFGRATGLSRIAEPPMSAEQKRGALRKGVLSALPGGAPAMPGARDRFVFDLAPFEGLEMKYEIRQGQAIDFRWAATAPVHYDMHAHPFDGGTKLTESYAIADAKEQAGHYVAPFTGIHGWFWQNRNAQPVQITLDASGAIVGSRTFTDMGERPRALTPPAGE